MGRPGGVISILLNLPSNVFLVGQNSKHNGKVAKVRRNKFGVKVLLHGYYVVSRHVLGQTQK